MIDLSVDFRDGITPSLLALDRLLANPKPMMKEVGQLMVTWIRESHDAQRSLKTKRPYHPLDARYAKAKRRAGGSPQRVLFGPSPGSGGAGGALFGSWGVRHMTPQVVVVGATGGRLNRVKASAHDGGLAQYLGRPELNRLQLGWHDKKLREVISAWLDHLVEEARKARGG